MDELLKDILALLQDIQAFHKTSLGALKNAYVPYLSVKRVNQLEHRVQACLTALGPPRPPKGPCPDCTEPIKDLDLVGG